MIGGRGRAGDRDSLHGSTGRAQVGVEFVVPPVITVKGIAEFVGVETVARQRDTEAEAHVAIVRAPEFQRARWDHRHRVVAVAIADLIGRRALDHGDDRLPAYRPPTVIGVPQIGESDPTFDDLGHLKSNAVAVEQRTHIRRRRPRQVPRGIGVRHQLAPLGQLGEHARAPGGIQPGRIVELAVAVGIDLDGIALVVRGQPRLRGEEVVEEHPVLRKVGGQDLVVGETRLHGRDLGPGQVHPPRPRPHFDAIALGVVQVRRLGHVRLAVALDGVDRTQHQHIRVEAAQLRDLGLAEARSQPQIDARTVWNAAVLLHFPRTPQIADARIAEIDGRKCAVAQVQRPARAAVAADIDFVNNLGVGGEAGDGRAVRGRAFARDKGRGLPAIANGPRAVGGRAGGQAEVHAGCARGQKRAGRCGIAVAGVASANGNNRVAHIGDARNIGHWTVAKQSITCR